MTQHLTPELPDRYRIVRELGRGGMAVVYLAEDRKHHRQVAIKVLRQDLSAAIGAERFLREIELTAGLQHPHILPLFDSGEAGGALYYVMPFVEGESLRDRLTREGRLAPADALAIGRDVAAALTWAHARGVVHRDIKPENILLSEGGALVADFGIALAFSSVEGGRLTVAGLSVGTPAYMSPEQIASDTDIDGRSDQYSLACVLFEMLTGRPPFMGDNAQSIFAQALVDEPRRARTFRGDVPAATDAALARALAKDPAARFETAKAFIDACEPPGTSARAPVRAWPTFVAVGAFAIVLALLWQIWSNAQIVSARAEMPAIAVLAEEERFVEAWEQAVRLERRLAGDSAFTALLHEISDVLNVTSEPAGARVYVQRLSGTDEPATDSIALGTTPLGNVRIPRVDHRVTLHARGHHPAERIASSGFQRTMMAADTGRVITLDVVLLDTATNAGDMVAVPGGGYALIGPDLPIGLDTDLHPFYIDRFEVSNARYRDFVRGGGYVNAAHWDAAGAAMRGQFVDRTGLAGPREWRNQEPPAGLEEHPVTGVSWYEARAYCVAQGKRLPTLFEWEKAARDGVVSPFGVIMPWGYASAARMTARRANFSGTGTAAVDAYPFGVSPYGVHALAGNVKEWLANPVGDGYAVAGGSWQDPAYVFSEVGSLAGTTVSPAVGFRCARDAVPGTGDQGARPLRLAAPPPEYRPVDEAGFRALLSFYRYDRRPANARVSSVIDMPDWQRERLWLDGPAGDSILAYLYLPKQAEPPYQTIIYVPSSAAFFLDPVWRRVEEDLGPHIKAGRAVFAVVFEGMIERPWPRTTQPPPSNSVGFRDLMVRHATQLRMGIDYLTTRAEIDTARLAYLGMSWGAGSRLVFAGADDRYRAVVFIGGGIDERVQPTLPEAANFNFAAHIRAPKLLINGRQDEEHPWTTRAKPLWDLLREPKELVLIDGAGHHPPQEDRVAPINAFLDRTLGPVRLRAPLAR
jgi:eukaryotic-like serine/threonine-protein kinase